MPDNDLIEVLGEWKGYRVGMVERHPPAREGGRPEVCIELIRKDDGPMICSACGQACDRYHDWQDREIRDLPILDAQTRLRVQRFRVDCPRCGPKVERLPWLGRYARMTTRLAESVARLCAVLPVKQVADHYDLHWETVKRIDKEYLQRTLGAVDLSEVEVIAMDEFAIQKGHRYATVIVEPYRKQVLWVCRGRSRKDLRPFFELLGPKGRARLKAVAMDMSRAYEEEVRAQCPQAKVVFDLFHVVAKYG